MPYTQDVHNRIAIVECESGKVSTQCKRPKCVSRCREYTGNATNHIGSNNSRHTTEMIRHPAE